MTGLINRPALSCSFARGTEIKESLLQPQGWLCHCSSLCISTFHSEYSAETSLFFNTGLYISSLLISIHSRGFHCKSKHAWSTERKNRSPGKNSFCHFSLSEKCLQPGMATSACGPSPCSVSEMRRGCLSNLSKESTQEMIFLSNVKSNT